MKIKKQYRSHPFWMLAACVPIFLSSCISQPATNSIIVKTQSATVTPVMSTRTPTSTATLLPTQTGTPVPPTSTSTLTATPQELPEDLASLQIVYHEQGRIQLWQSGKIYDLMEYSGESLYMDYEMEFSTLPLLFSDDGAYIAFLQYDGAVTTIRPDGTDPRLIYDEHEGDPYHERPYLIGWLPGTHTLLFSKIYWLATSIYAQIGTCYAANIDTGEVTKVEVFPNHDGTFLPAPDGTHIAVISYDELVVVDAFGEKTNLWTFPQITSTTWSSDSQSLLAVVLPQGVDETGNASVEIWQVFLDGRNPQRLSLIPAALVFVDIISAVREPKVWIAPDLTHLAYLKIGESQDGLFELHISSIDQSEDHVVFQGKANRVEWAPDSKKLVFRRLNEKPDFLLADISGDLRLLTNIPGYDIAWVDDENLLLFTGKEYWWVGVDRGEALVTRLEVENLYLRYFREFDFRK